MPQAFSLSQQPAAVPGPRRHHLADIFAEEEQRGWIAALHDRQVGKALALMHRQPGRDWRVASLAREVGMSRSGFSARFTTLVGEPVLQYLTDLRMQLAHRELLQGDDSLATIAGRVGYQSEPAFNRAFKREVGMPPGAVRRMLR